MSLRSALREYEKTGKLSVLLPFARRKFHDAHEDARYFIQLRQLSGGPAEVVMCLPETPPGMRRDAAGVVVVAAAADFASLLA
jgi:hypothetical protein